jgi:rhodanese-related sulfurtransferase
MSGMNQHETIPRISAREIDTTTTPTLDARSHPGKEQIRGALRYDPKALLGEEPLTLPLPHAGRIIVYADNEERAVQIAARLREEGYADACVLQGGFEAYHAAGLPVEQLTQQQPVPGSESGIPRI